MKKRILQSIMQIIANYIIYMLENSRDENMFNHYFEMGATLNAYAVVMHDIYLD